MAPKSDSKTLTVEEVELSVIRFLTFAIEHAKYTQAKAKGRTYDPLLDLFRSDIDAALEVINRRIGSVFKRRKEKLLAFAWAAQKDFLAEQLAAIERDDQWTDDVKEEIAEALVSRFHRLTKTKFSETRVLEVLKETTVADFRTSTISGKQGPADGAASIISKIAGETARTVYDRYAAFRDDRFPLQTPRMLKAIRTALGDEAHHGPRFAVDERERLLNYVARLLEFPLDLEVVESDFGDIVRTKIPAKRKKKAAKKPAPKARKKATRRKAAPRAGQR